MDIQIERGRNTVKLLRDAAQRPRLGSFTGAEVRVAVDPVDLAAAALVIDGLCAALDVRLVKGEGEPADGGGPAFPSEQGLYSPDGTKNELHSTGMSLLDYFAGQALANMAGTNEPAKVAVACYDFAQAMVAESRKRK